jgi:hypothetical protein
LSYTRIINDVKSRFRSFLARFWRENQWGCIAG